MDTGANAGCSTGECEGEEQEDPSSSSFVNEILEVNDPTDLEGQQEEFKLPATTRQENRSASQQKSASNLTGAELADNDNPLADVEQAETGDDELSAFREQWQRELEGTPAPLPEVAVKEDQEEPLGDVEMAKKFFLKGADLERSGKWYEAIQQYKRAMAIVPDIELRIYKSMESRADTPQEPAPAEASQENTSDEEEDEDVVEGEDLMTRLLRIQARRGLICQPKHPTNGAHISWLPYEVILVILRWVVSSDLDVISLERAGATCRALYTAARDPDIWRAICVRTWGIECGSARAQGYGSWRAMWVSRPRLQLHGCYISRTTYLRHGETSFQDHFYRPWYLIEYYRYLRFFPEGLVLMWTTAEEPATCVAQLKYRNVKPGLGILSGHYRLIGDKVAVVIKKSSAEKKSSQANTRFRSRRKDPEPEQTFHLELQLLPVKTRRNARLSWRGYSMCSRREQWTQFELSPASFPPFSFSRVRTYCADAAAPLLQPAGAAP